MRTPEKLKELFNQPYQRDAWIGMLAERLQIDQFSQPIAIPGDARAFYQLGKTVLADDKELGIYEIKTNPETQLHCNRVQLRQLVAKQCQQSALDGALAVYYDNRRHWRFSFISMEYKLNEQGQLDRQESVPKRYTYLLGKSAKIRTAAERFSRLNKTATLDDLKTAFAVGQLNKEFYEKLFKWYERAKSQVVFPNDEREEKDRHVSTSLIRLLTRLLFVWFLKEKELVNWEFFEPDKIRKIIDWNKESGYYKAILQNLFFATLNREIKDRTFRTTTNGKPNSNNYLVTNIYRYQNVFLQQDKNAILRLFEQTPFLNGGLFECLDRDANEDEQQAYEKDKTIRKERPAIRIDGFSDRDDNPLCVPNELFFNNDEDNPGLVQLLAQYQFTVEESTPLDADVALDPELLGLVFENLLAAYNPETKQTARKASGSYYTPREIVNYMVDESLKAYFVQATDVADDKISRLFQTVNAKSDLTENETTALIQAIDNIKIIDPAVGSGAFPMGILQRLVQILGIVDPENKQWKQQQIDLIEKLPDPESREQTLKEVETIFSEKNRFNDFSRKLYLIKKCIYGVDIQPIACQIAKLRFFISLAIEQEPTDNAADNYGIKPLPNLETKFVAADTLRGLDQPAQHTLRQTDAVKRPTRKKSPKLLPAQRALVQTDAVTRLEQGLNANRERHFRATTRRTKEKCRKKDKELRDKLAAELKQAGFPATAADKIANWDPYDQNACADWFDPEYMFGVRDDFDVVIGNPPYIQLQKDGGKLRKLYEEAGFSTFAKSGDIYQLFYERGCRILKPLSGLLAYITSNSWLKAQYGKATRRYFSERHTPLRLIELGKDVFENAIVDSSILIARCGKHAEACRAVDMDSLTDKDFPPAENHWAVFRPHGEKPWGTLSAIEKSIMDKMKAVGTPLKDWDVKIYRGILTGLNEAFIIDDVTRQTLIANDPKSAEIIKPVLRGKDIQRYHAQWAGLWLIYSHSKIAQNEYPAVRRHLLPHKEQLLKRRGGANPKTGQVPYEWWQLQVDYYSSGAYKNFAKEKLFWMHMAPNGRFAYSDSKTVFCNQKVFVVTGNSLKYLCAILNSRLITWQIKNIAVTTGMGLIQWDKFVVERLPIPKITHTEQRQFIRLVDTILRAKAADSKADTTEQEAEINQLVYGLYGLTTEEIRMIEHHDR